MPTYSITGTIKQIGQTQEISPTFKKRELILLEPVGNRDQPVPIEFIQDDGAMLDQFAPGEKVTVSFFINGREWTARDGTVKYFLSLKGQHSLMVVEHDMHFIRAIAGEQGTVTVLADGSVLAEGTIDQVQADERVIEVYLGR